MSDRLEGIKYDWEKYIEYSVSTLGISLGKKNNNTQVKKQ